MCAEEVNADYRFIQYNANKVSEWLHSLFRVVTKQHQDIILCFNWLQSANPKVDCVNYSVALNNRFIAADIPIHHNIKVELCSFQVVLHLLYTNKLVNSWFAFF